MRVTRLQPSDYLRSPWKNGGGVSIDITGASTSDSNSAPSTWDDTVWRFGRTTIEAAGPFSDLTGFDRLQMVVAGRGLVLQSPDREIDLRQPGGVVRYAGELPIVTRLEDGPVEVVNLMGLRQRVSIDLSTLAAQGTAVLSAGVHVLYAVSEACELVCDGTRYALPRDHALRIDCSADTTVFNKAGSAVVASVFSKQTQPHIPKAH